MNPRHLLRIEGVAIFGVATATYLLLGGPAWLYLLFFFVPDLGMLGYIANSNTGSRTYNVVHTYVLPLVLGGIVVWQATPSVVLIAAIWMAHIGFDRALGYGLKYPTAFGDTHLSDRVITATDESRVGIGTNPLLRRGVGCESQDLLYLR